jgi:histidinol dehydrogenase
MIISTRTGNMEYVMRIYDNVEEARRTILRRPDVEEVEIPPALAASLERLFGRPISPAEAVQRIIRDVRERGDAALMEWTRRIDGVELAALEVPREAWLAARDVLEPDLRQALELAAERIAGFHQRQHVDSWTAFDAGGMLGQIVRPLQRVGVYVPAGTAPLPSSLLMAAVPARAAGVEEIVVVSPPHRRTGEIAPVILAAAAIAGVERVFRAGGAQAIAALAYGTESIPRVDKIVGPGNLFVALAKRMVFGQVGIDGIYGPTETLVIADESAPPAVVAADLLAQAEHDVLASAVLLTPSERLARAVQEEVRRQAARLSRQDTIAGSLSNRSGIVLVRDLEQAVELANEYAPEHLCLLVAEPWEYVWRVRHAGGIFVGEHSFEVLGDYVAGPSHVMPTGGTARFASPLNVMDFVKVTSLVALGRAELDALGPAAARIAAAEGLTAHAHAVYVRRPPASPSPEES